MLDYDFKNYEINIELMNQNSSDNKNGTDPNYKVILTAKKDGDFALANFNFVKGYKDNMQTNDKNSIDIHEGVLESDKIFVKTDKKYTKDNITYYPEIYFYIDSETGIIEFDKKMKYHLILVI